MAKRTLIVAVSIGVSVVVAAMGFVAYKAVAGQSTGDVVRVSDARREAKQLLALCDNPEAVKVQLVESAEKLEVDVERDPELGRQVVNQTVMPMIESRLLACRQAQRDLAEVKHSLTGADPFVDDAIPRVDAMVGKLGRAIAAAKDLLAAFDRRAPAGELRDKLPALRTAMN